MTELHNVRGRITDLHRGSLHDGPGIRTSVFLKGCPLRCVWCHNPETWTSDRQIGFTPAKCSRCGACQSACPCGCHHVTAAGHSFDRTVCTACAVCIQACAKHSGSRALIAWGRDTTAGAVVAEAARDRPYYQRSGGGLTISGGEPLAQPLFTEALLRLAREQGIHTCLDTNGYASSAVFRRLAPLADLLLFDLKADHRLHRELTGVDLGPILANLDWALANNVAVHLRCPLVPGINDDEAHLARIADYAKRPGVVGCDVMPYHRYGADKWARLGLEYPLAGQADASPEDEQRWRDNGFDVLSGLPKKSPEAFDERHPTTKTKENPMKSIVTSLLTGSLFLSAAMAGETGPAGGAVTKDVPYGHKDFVPTPERPVYFRQTYGNYPGATPPLEWWEGTPTTRKVENRTIPDFADQKSKNILWKVPVPGWSLSHPIVVGKKVFAVGEPDFVTCWDLETGKQLWQRRIMPLLCDGLSEDKAAAGQKVLDLARAFFYISALGYTAGEQHNNLFRGWNRDGTPTNPDHAAFVAEKKAMAQKLLDAFTPHRPEVEAFGDAALLAALDKDLEIIKRFQAVADLEVLKVLMKENKRTSSLIDACLKVLGVGIGGVWWGYVGSADSTLASDGQRIYGVFKQGQVFALDLDGKTVWLRREKGACGFHRSPLLCGDLLLVRNPGKTKSVTSLHALDVKTGQVRWETPLSDSCYAVPCLMRLPGADGKPVDVLVGNAPENPKGVTPVLRMTDGKILGHLPPQRIARGQMMAVFGQQVTWAEDTGPACSYRLRLEGADTLVAEEVFVDEGRKLFAQNEFPTVAGTTWICPGDSRGCLLRDGTTGALLGKAPVANSFGVVAGHYLITLSGGNNAPGWPPPPTAIRDGASGMFSVTDIKDPAKPVVVARNNLLGYKEPAADLIVSTYFKDFDPFDFTGCYRGSASYFMMMSGPVPAGDKLLIQSTRYMYCIGHREGSGPQVGEK